MTPRLNDLFHRSAAIALDRQLWLAELVADSEWHIDVSEARLTFGDRYRWAVQFLGTESYADGTWRWAWSNRSGLPHHGLSSAVGLRDAGDQNGIAEFTEARLPLGDIDGHTLATVASVLRSANAYYRCPYEDGALFVLIQDLWYPRTEIEPVERVATVFPQSLAALPLSDHRLAWTSYLAYYGLDAVADGDSLVTARDGVPVLRATFDDLNRLTRLEAQVGGARGQP